MLLLTVTFNISLLRPVSAGETLHATSEVIGLKETSNRKSGVVYVRTTGRNGDEPVLSYVRWVLVRKRDEAAPAPDLAMLTVATRTLRGFLAS